MYSIRKDRQFLLVFYQKRHLLTCHQCYVDLTDLILYVQRKHSSLALRAIKPTGKLQTRLFYLSLGIGGMVLLCVVNLRNLLYVEFLELYGRLLITEKRTLRAMGIRDVTEISLS